MSTYIVSQTSIANAVTTVNETSILLSKSTTLEKIISEDNKPLIESITPLTRVIQSVNENTTTIVDSGIQGPPGIQGPAGPIGDAFQIMNKFSELDTEQKKADARINLELQNIDCGTFN